MKAVKNCKYIRKLSRSSSHTSYSGVWRAVAELPVSQSSLVTLRGQPLAIGGSTDVRNSGDGMYASTMQPPTHGM